MRPASAHDLPARVDDADHAAALARDPLQEEPQRTALDAALQRLLDDRHRELEALLAHAAQASPPATGTPPG